MDQKNNDQSNSTQIPKTKGDVVAALFVSKEPLKLDELSRICEEDKDVVLRWIFELQKDLSPLGIVIQQVAGGFEMVTDPKHFDTISKIVPKTYESLRKPVMETVTIVAFNQPTQRKTIQLLREVKDPDNGIQGAMDLKLIQRTEEGYVTTDEFLKYFHINDLKELPQRLKEISSMKEDDFKGNEKVGGFNE